MSDERTLEQRVAAIHRYGDPVTEWQREAAVRLLRDLLAAAGQHGYTLKDFDVVVDLPGGCLDVVLIRS